MRDRGQAAVEFALAVGVLMLPVALVVTAFGPWSQTRVAARSVAAEAARAAVTTLDQEVGNHTAVEVTSDYGMDPPEVRIGWCGASPGPLAAPTGSCGFARGGSVSVEVELWTPLVDTPWGPVGGLWVRAEHAEPIDLYRSLD